MSWKTFHISRFEGLHEARNPHDLAEGELSKADDVWRWGGGIVGTRPGTVKDADDYTLDIAGTPKVCGMSDFRRTRDSVRDLVVVVPGALHYEDGNTLDIATNSVRVVNAANENSTFAIYRGVLYAAGGDVDAGTPDQPWFWDPATGGGHVADVLAIPDLSATNRSPRFIKSFSNRLFASGFNNHDSSANEEVVRFTALGQGTVWPVGNTIGSGGFSSVGGFSAAGDEFMTGLGDYEDNQGKWLVVLSNRRLYNVEELSGATAPFRIRDSVAHGCVNQNAFVGLGLDSGDAIYLSSEGIHSLRQSQNHPGSETSFLSHKIRDTFASLNRAQLENVVAAYDRQEGMVLFAVPTGSSTQNDLILALDVSESHRTQLTAQTARWYRWTLQGTNHRAAALLQGRDQGGAFKIFGGNYKGQVFTFSNAAYSDLGQAYVPEFISKHSHLGSPLVEKALGDVLVDLLPGGSYKPTFQAIFDFGRNPSPTQLMEMPATTSLFDTAIFDVDKFSDRDTVRQALLYGEGSGDTIAFRFTHSGLNEPFFVAQVSFQLDEGGFASHG